MVIRKQNDIINFINSDRIAHALMMRSFFEPDLGLFEGQMGIVLALEEYSVKTDNKIFADFSYDLLEIIIAKANKGLTFHLSDGLSGIGLGIEYLIQNKLVEGESVEICEEIDKKIMETDPRRIENHSLENGFEGLLLYIIYHLQGAVKQRSKLPFDNTYLLDIYSVCKNLKSKNINKESLRILCQAYTSFIEDKNMPDYGLLLTNLATNVPKIDYDKLTTYPIGLNKGIAGALVHLIKKE